MSGLRYWHFLYQDRCLPCCASRAGEQCAFTHPSRARSGHRRIRCRRQPVLREHGAGLAKPGKSIAGPRAGQPGCTAPAAPSGSKRLQADRACDLISPGAPAHEDRHPPRRRYRTRDRRGSLRSWMPSTCQSKWTTRRQAGRLCGARPSAAGSHAATGERPMPCCSVPWATGATTSWSATCALNRPSSGCAGDGPVRQSPAGALLSAAGRGLQPQARAGLRPRYPDPPRCHRRRLLRPAARTPHGGGRAFPGR